MIYFEATFTILMNINYFLIILISIFKPIIIITCVLELIIYESINLGQQLIYMCQNNAKRQIKDLIKDVLFCYKIIYILRKK